MLSALSNFVKKLMGGSRNDRIIRARMEIVRDEINPLEARMQELSDDDMLLYSRQLRQRLTDGEARSRILPEAFALVREATVRALGIRLYDVQLVAGQVLDHGWIAEEATGEGKTFACYPAIFMAALEGKCVHVVTVNDYLVQRDAGFAAQAFERLGYSVGFIASGMPNDERKAAYACDVTYGTNQEFGFDYLRDNMKLSTDRQVQRSLDYAIVDEIDSILIDEARTPLIISGPSSGNVNLYKKVDSVARELLQRQKPWEQANHRVESLQREVRALEGELSKNKSNAAIADELAAKQASLVEAEDTLYAETNYYDVELDRKSVNLTHEGIGAAQEIAGVGSFYVGGNVQWPHLLDQAMRAHLVYEKDVDYVVQNGQVIIVDQSTGRLMEGRQWSDGLHQAVESKERVAVKEETQTLATITLQNFYRLYDKLAGMTGTAITEAAEFMKIYKLDTVVVPTHRPVSRVDHNDRIYADVDAKFDAIVEEINAVSKAGRPVLVGTTSVEKSEKLSNALKRRYGIQHEVLNARPENAAREADIVALAGQQRPLKSGSKEMVGNVTIATNMAGRGTDIKLGEGVVDPRCRVPSDEELAEMGLSPDPLYPAGVNKCCISCDQYDLLTHCKHCFKPKRDKVFPHKGRHDCSVEVPCGLHIVGTERHEARRIDNQLRGRSGRQGDPGSSRFFLSLRDDLMAIFAGEWTVRILGFLGLQGDTAIEDKRISKGILRAQRKVEERNFEIRKNLIEYDEVMDHQRHGTYGRRQAVLEGRDTHETVWKMIESVIADATEKYLDGRYAARCIAEWVRLNMQIPFEAEWVKASSPKDQAMLEANVRRRACDEIMTTVTMTLGEYMTDGDESEWDLRGLTGWAMSRFGINLTQNQLRKMTVKEVETLLIDTAMANVEETDLADLGRFLDEDFPQRSLVHWASMRFVLDLSADDVPTNAEQATEYLIEQVRGKYRQRKIDYPVEFVMELTVVPNGTENVYACQQLAELVNRKYAQQLSGEHFQGRPLAEIREELRGLAAQWVDDDAILQAAQEALGSDPSRESIKAYASTRFLIDLTDEDFDADDSELDTLVRVGRQFIHEEFLQLQRFVLLQVYDACWKDHLLTMDRLRDTIVLQRTPDQDPKVLFKREGWLRYEEMLASIEDKVTDMIFKVRLSVGDQVSTVNEITETRHGQRSAYDGLQRDAKQMNQAGQGAPAKAETIRRETTKVGRNDPCPCGSGKKYKKCCGKDD